MTESNHNTELAKRKNDNLKNLLTNIVRVVIETKENAHYVDHSYIQSKKWSSALDFQTNQMVIDVIEALGLNPNDIEQLYKNEDMEGPYALAHRRPKQTNPCTDCPNSQVCDSEFTNFTKIDDCPKR